MVDPTHEFNFRQEGELDEVAFISGSGILVGQVILHEGTDWIILKDDGPRQVEGCVVRFICEPD